MTGDLEALADPGCGWSYRRDASAFGVIPGSPIAYWASDAVIKAFATNNTLGAQSKARSGLKTGNNDMFLREWHEVGVSSIGIGMSDTVAACASGCKWFPYNKGGEYRNWYGNRSLVVNYANDGEEIRLHSRISGASTCFTSSDYYFHEGITWTALTSGRNSFRFSPDGAIFDSNKGPMLYPQTHSLLLYTLALLNASTNSLFITFVNPTLSLQNGDVDNLPYTYCNDVFETVLGLSNENIQISRVDWTS